MNCPSCKNPNVDNAFVCEWCGVGLNSQNIQENQVKGLDVEITGMLSKMPTGCDIDFIISTQMFKRAAYFYQKTTGKSMWESKYYVLRLNFFRIHKHATEIAWQKEWEKYKKELKAGWGRWFFGVLFFWTIFVPIIFIVENNQYKQYKKYGL